MTHMRSIFDMTDEGGVMRFSILFMVLVSTFGVSFGLASGSFSIMFDGICSLADACMSVLSLLVINLIRSYSVPGGLSRKLEKHFSMGFWHLEPMVLALNGILLAVVAVYALFNAVSSLLTGGRELEFGWAIAYALLTLATCVVIAILEARANRKIDSEFIRMDVKGWIMSGSITAALLIAFCLGYAVQGTRLEWISPYIDPAVLVVVCVVIIPMPIATIRRSLSEILLVTPQDLELHVDMVARTFVDRHGFLTHRAYVAKVGRSRTIELCFIVPRDMPPMSIPEWDDLRDEIGEMIGDDGPDRWLTIVFTSVLD